MCDCPWQHLTTLSDWSSALNLTTLNYYLTIVQYINIIPSFLDAGDVRFSLNGTTYQNNSLVNLEDIGGGDNDALLCITNFTSCCRSSNTSENESATGNWFFPNGTRVAGTTHQWDFHRTRDQMAILMHRKRGGVDGIYHCIIPDSTSVTQTIYIGVYTSGSGEWHCLYIHSYSVQLYCI